MAFDASTQTFRGWLTFWLGRQVRLAALGMLSILALSITGQFSSATAQDWLQDEQSPEEIFLGEMTRLPGVDEVFEPTSPEQMFAPPPGVVVVMPAPPPPEPVKKLWTSSLEIGLNGTSGNTDTFNMRVGSKLQRANEFNTTTWETTHLNKEDNGNKAARNVLSEVKMDWPFGATPWSYFLKGNLEYDEFKPFDLRLSSATGIGYDIYKGDYGHVTTRFGGSVSKEIDGVDDSYIPEFLFGLEWKLKPSKIHTFEAKIEYMPAVEAMGDFRFNASASWETLVDPDWGMSLKFSAIERYDSTPNMAQPEDIDYAVLLKWAR